MPSLKVKALWSNHYDSDHDFHHCVLQNEGGHVIAYVEEPKPNSEIYFWYAGPTASINIAKGKTDDLDEAKEAAEEALEKFLEETTDQTVIFETE